MHRFAPGAPGPPLPRRRPAPRRRGRRRGRAHHLRRRAPRPRRRSPSVAWGLVVADEAQHVKNPLSRDRPGAARDPGPGAGRAHRHAGREPPDRAVGDPRLDHARPARPARDVPPHGRRARRARRATRPRPSASPAWSGPFLLRRRKSDPAIAPELPPKTETDRRRLAHRRAGHALRGGRARDDGRDRATPRASPAAAWCSSCSPRSSRSATTPRSTSASAGRSPAAPASSTRSTSCVDAILAEGDSVLVFTQYVAMGRLLERAPRRAAASPSQFLHGGVPVRRARGDGRRLPGRRGAACSCSRSRPAAPGST